MKRIQSASVIRNRSEKCVRNRGSTFRTPSFISLPKQKVAICRNLALENKKVSSPGEYPTPRAAQYWVDVHRNGICASLQEKLRRTEWAAVAVTGIGIVGLGASSEEEAGGVVVQPMRIVVRGGHTLIL